MGTLGDAFPDSFKKDYSERNIKVGSVIISLDRSTIPIPKEKRFVIIGETPDHIALGTIYINSEINFNVIRTQDLRDLQFEVLAEGRDYLDHDSYIDCSKIKLRNKAELLQLLKDKPEACLGEVSTHDLALIIQNVRGAITISPAEKASIGL